MYIGIPNFPCNEKNGMENPTAVKFFSSVILGIYNDWHSFHKFIKNNGRRKKVPRKQVKQLKQQIHIMHWLYHYIYKHAHNSYPV